MSSIQNRSTRSSSPQPTQQQIEKLKAAQNAIKKRNKKDNFFSTYKHHILISCMVSFVLIIVLAFSKNEESIDVIVPKEIERHNSLGYPYILGENEFFQNYTIPIAKNLFKNDFTFSYNVTKCKPHNINFPQTYNFKTEYPQCNHAIYNQGNCSSAYAISTVSTFSDRMCRQKQTPQLAAQDLLSCDNKLNIGCKGGQITRTVDYIIKHGVTLSECHPFRGVEGYENCTKIECERYKADNYCKLLNKDEIKKDILLHGPVVALMTMHKDFLVYRDGIYQVLEGTPRYPGFQAVKIYGWGEENGYQYWLVENSFGESWGIGGLSKVTMDGFLDLSEYALSIRLE